MDAGATVGMRMARSTRTDHVPVLYVSVGVSRRLVKPVDLTRIVAEFGGMWRRIIHIYVQQMSKTTPNMACIQYNVAFWRHFPRAVFFLVFADPNLETKKRHRDVQLVHFELLKPDVHG